MFINMVVVPNRKITTSALVRVGAERVNQEGVCRERPGWGAGDTWLFHEEGRSQPVGILT